MSLSISTSTRKLPTSNEERFIHGGEALWIKRRCTEPRYDASNAF